MIEGSVSNCHLKETDVSLICSGAYLEWKGPDVTETKINCLV